MLILIVCSGWCRLRTWAKVFLSLLNFFTGTFFFPWAPGIFPIPHAKLCSTTEPYHSIHMPPIPSLEKAFICVKIQPHNTVKANQTPMKHCMIICIARSQKQELKMSMTFNKRVPVSTRFPQHQRRECHLNLSPPLHSLQFLICVVCLWPLLDKNRVNSYQYLAFIKGTSEMQAALTRFLTFAT